MEEESHVTLTGNAQVVTSHKTPDENVEQI